MSGICGIVCKDIRERLNVEHLLPMIGALGSSGTQERETLNFDSVRIGCSGFTGHLTGIAELNVNGHAMGCAFHGSLYNTHDLFPDAENDKNYLDGFLQLYIKEGISFLKRLNGEFVLALWDGRYESLYLATDRFRMHPVFYYLDSERLVFATRMKGIMACPLAANRTINHEAIVDVAASSVTQTPKTIFREVKKLPPGHYLTYKHGQISLEPYWDINFLNSSSSGEKALARQLRTCLAEAISVRLGVDGSSNHIGSFLSGGIDSSTLTGLLTQLAEKSVKSFTIGFNEQQFNEINYAKIAARAFKSDYHEYFVSPQDTYDAIPVLMEWFDEPYANASAIPTYFCAKLAKENGVDILYAGDGGDELFAGNERYATQKLFDYYYRIPAMLRNNLVKPLVVTLADILRWDLFIKGKKYIKRASTPFPERFSGLFEIISIEDFLEGDLIKIVGHDYNYREKVGFHYYNAAAKNELDKLLYVDLKLAISDNDLFKVTRMTEAAAVTVRFPFLDHKLAEFAATVPAHIKMRGRKLRSFFKNAYSDFLPQEILNKTKHGFGLPIPVWLRTDNKLNAMMHDLVLSPRSIQRGYFRKKTLEDIMKRHNTDETSFYGTILWNIMMIELWHRRYVD